MPYNLPFPDPIEIMELVYQPGELIAQRYRILEPLGEGGSGMTYCAQQLETGERVALKVLSLRNQADWKRIELFEREAQVLAKLEHPGIPRYVEYFYLDTEVDRTFYIAQQLAQGQTLAQLVETGWHGTEAQIKQIAIQILNILVYLHQLKPPVVHRDIKPQNIIIKRDGSLGDQNSSNPQIQVSLVDFGAVQQTYHSTLARGSTIVGTFGYMAPEQFRGQAVPATDLYGLGATILFLLTHRSPSDLPVKGLKINFRDRVKISPQFADWLEKMLEPDVDRRFASASEALKVLGENRSLKKSRTLGTGILTWGSLIVISALLTLCQEMTNGSQRVGSVRTPSFETVAREIESGDIQALRNYLHQEGSANFTSTDNRDRTSLLHGAVSVGNLKAMELLVKKGADVNVRDHYGRTPLHSAASLGKLEEIELLVKKGADVNVRDSNDSSPLHSAAGSGKLEAIELLVKKGADVNVRDSNDSSPLHSAAGSGNPRAIQLLIDKGADLTFRNKDGSTPLHLVASSGKPEAIELLVKKSADVNARDNYGRTPLHLAIFSGNQDAIEVLANKGADVNSRDDYGRTLLHTAASVGNQDAVEVLANKGADVNSRDRDGNTPLYLAISSGNQDAVELLIDKKADVNVLNKSGITPVHWAAFSGNLEAIELLVKNKADVNMRDNDGKTPLHLAGNLGYVGAIELLVSKGAKIDVGDKYGNTPLHGAATLGSPKAIDLLVNKGANVNIRDRYGYTPVHRAAQFGHSVAIDALVKKGANVNIRSTDGKTPLLLALSSGNSDAIELLKRYGAKE